MFCFQCEQTAGCKSCVGSAGVCGKKADTAQIQDKLTEVFKYNNIRSVTVTRMTVPCCGGLSYAVKTAIEQSGRDIPLQIVTISPDGRIIR